MTSQLLIKHASIRSDLFHGDDRDCKNVKDYVINLCIVLLDRRVVMHS